VIGVLTRRALNRATLARQWLLARQPASVVDALDHLVGLQAQTPLTWYVGLWDRLVAFDPASVSELLVDRRVTRIAAMRSTIHLLTAEDAMAIRPLVQPVLDRSLNGNFGKNLVGVDRPALLAAARELLDAEPMVFSRLGARLAERWPDRDPDSLAQAVRCWMPLVQVPPRGAWGRSGLAKHAPAESWLGVPPRADYPIDDLVLRYLGAFGPASVKDVQTWSGLTRLGEVLDRLRPRLVAYRGEDDRELFDLPDAPRPDPDTPALPRLLYDFDNLLLSHADRSRVITEDYVQADHVMDGPVPRLFLLDGFTAGTWTTTISKDAATLALRPFRRLSTKDSKALVAEAEALLDFLAPAAAERGVTLVPPVTRA